MPHVLLINEDNTISTTQRARIMQRSKCVDNLWILVYPIYKGIDMSGATVMLEYLKPVSRRYKTEILTMSGMYEDYLKYTLPFDTELTDEAGSIEVQITFTMVDLDPDGNAIQRVRKTSKNIIPIVPISAWSDIVPDSALSSLDQRLLKLDAQTKGLEAYAEFLAQNQVDNLIYDEKNDSLQLMTGANTVGDAVSVRDMLDGGIPVIDLDSMTGVDSPEDGCDCDCWNNVVEFGYDPVVEEGQCCPCGCEDNVVEFGYDSTGNADAPVLPEDDESNVILF